MRTVRAHLAAALASLAIAGCGEAPQGSPGEEQAPGAEAVNASASVEEGEDCDLTGSFEAPGECARFERQYADLDAGRDAFSPQETMKEGETRTVSYAVTRLPKAVQGDGGELAEAVPPSSPVPVGEEASATPDGGSSGVATDDAGDIAAQPAPEDDHLAASPDPAPTGPTQREIEAAIAETDEQNAAALGDASSEVETGQIKVARFMYACLGGSPALKVEPTGCQSRDTREDPQVVWNWQVTATTPGQHRLNLRSGVEVRTRKGEGRRIGQRAVNRTITVAVTRRGWFERAMAQAEWWLNSPVKAIGALTALLLAIVALIAATRKLRNGGGGDAESG